MLYRLFNRGQKCRYFCQDETRLGLKTISGKMITLMGVKPKGNVQWRRENFFLYGAIEVMNGENYFYEFPFLNRQCFQIFVNQLAQEFPETLNFLQLDNAPFHQNIDFPENIIPVFQPPHSPELNPLERFWQELKRNLKWENCNNLEELQQRLSEILNQIELEELVSLTGWDYLVEAILSATS